MRHRKEINDVLDTEFDLFASALNQMKSSGMWDTIAKVHAASGKQHFKSYGDPDTFLPWHRKFMVEVENRLQMAARETGVSNSDACMVTIPYWNWVLEEGTFVQSKTFASDRMGALDNLVENGDLDAVFCVKDGKFGKDVASSKFGARSNPFQGGFFMQEGCKQRWGKYACSEFLGAVNKDVQKSDCIMRKGKGRSELWGRRTPKLTYAQIYTKLIEDYKGIDNYVAMANFIEREIGMHFHGAVGGQRHSPETRRRTSREYGHMTSMYAPYDPIFFLHYGFLDFLWSQWQDAHMTKQTRDHRSGHYLNNMLFDAGTDMWPVTDVSMALDIKDDDPATLDHNERACVKYQERQTHHASR